MCGLKTTLKIGECLHKLSHIFTRSGIDVVMQTQMLHETGQQPLRRTNRLQGEMRDIVAHARDESAHLIAQKCAEVYMLKHEFDSFDIFIEAGALCGKEPHAAFRLIVRERKKADEEKGRNENEDEVSHGD